MKKWSRTPTHIMRENCIGHVIRNWKPLSFIEFGAGTGDITLMLLDKGFHGKCYDLGEENRKILRRNLLKYSNQVEVIDILEQLNGQLFDYLFAFEVLEHIKNDFETLKIWSSYLKSGGKVLISVPAHMKKYNKDDEFVGHIRRYEKIELIKLLEKTGFTDINVLNYGYPLSNITKVVSVHLYGSKNNLSPEERSIKSGTERLDIMNKLSFLFKDSLFLPFILLQKIFFKRDLGIGYVVSAEKL